MLCSCDLLFIPLNLFQIHIHINHFHFLSCFYISGGENMKNEMFDATGTNKFQLIQI